MPSKLLIRIDTFEPEGETPITSKVIDFNKKEDFEWYKKHFYWALLNYKELEICRSETRPLEGETPQG